MFKSLALLVVALLLSATTAFAQVQTVTHGGGTQAGCNSPATASSQASGFVSGPGNTIGDIRIGTLVLPAKLERIPPERAKEYRIQGAKKAALVFLNGLRHTTTEYDVLLSALNQELTVAGITLDELEKWEKGQLEAEKKAKKEYWKLWLHQLLSFN